MDVAKINELQDHFDGRGRLKQVVDAIKCYTNTSSIFLSYTDGWGKKKYLNIPIEPFDLLPILQKYIDNIDKDIVKLTSAPVRVLIVNSAVLDPLIKDYQSRCPSTFTSYDTIVYRLASIYAARVADKGNGVSDPMSYHIEVCSDWQDKIYMFSFLGMDKTGTAKFQFDDIYKL
ncbi:MAG: hypothetical protein K2O24_03940 [Muribaculaceae bacterium]|nr:hypothetical protein [Muribaculaceae bacterium]